MTHLRDLRDLRGQAFVAAAPQWVATGTDEEIERRAWQWLGMFPCRGCAKESTCALAYEPSNEGRDSSECAREMRA